MTDVPLPFELQFPGTWLALPDKRASWDVQGALQLVRVRFSEATMALILFEENQKAGFPIPTREERNADSERRAELSRAMAGKSAAGAWLHPAESWEVDIQVDRELMKEKLQRGQIPRDFLHTIPFIYAKAFLYAADSIGKILDQLAQRTDIPTEAQTACREFYKSFPSLRAVRDSALHVEDRGRGLGKRDEPLGLKPVQNPMICAPGGVLIIESLSGNRFGGTMADGHFGELEISSTTLSIMRDRIQAVLDTLPWYGPPHHFPSPC